MGVVPLRTWPWKTPEGMEVVMVKAAVAVRAGAPLSAILTVKLAVPPTVGEPVIAPVVLLMERPAGRAPWEIDQV